MLVIERGFESSILPFMYLIEVVFKAVAGFVCFKIMSSCDYLNVSDFKSVGEIFKINSF